MDKEREAPADDGPIFYQDQFRERLDQYQVKSNEYFYYFGFSIFRNFKPN
jgi:hypothetical protein